MVSSTLEYPTTPGSRTRTQPKPTAHSMRRSDVAVVTLAAVVFLVVLMAYGFAARRGGEAQALESIRAALDASGHAWAAVDVTGRKATLLGTPPSQIAAADAVTVASTATCETWYGPQACAWSVASHFPTPISRPAADLTVAQSMESIADQ